MVRFKCCIWGRTSREVMVVFLPSRTLFN
jgi:hypothetical protein